ncbi:MAG: ABC transporter substrate-binding protein [Actinomycetota bacterium]
MIGDTRSAQATARITRRSAVCVLLAIIGLATACSSARLGSEADDATSTSVAGATQGDGATPDAEAEAEAAARLDELSAVDEAKPGQLIWVHHVEPPDLHADDPDNDTVIAAWIRQGLLEGLFGIDASLAWYPELLDGEPELAFSRGAEVTITYTLRPDLRWSDGEPLTSADVAYTHEIIVEGCATEADGSIIDNSNDGCQYDMATRSGYDLVTDVDVVDEQTFTVSFAAFYPAWRNLYDQVFAAHVFGVDAFTVNQTIRRWQVGSKVLPSSGPLVFERWSEGRSIELGRNDEYHGSRSPDAVNDGPATVEGVMIAFVPDQEAGIELIADGAADLVMAETSALYAPLAASDDFTVRSTPGAVYEHWSLNLLDPHLSKPEVREAVAFALDKAEIVERVYGPLTDGVLAPEGLGNVFWLPGQSGYEDHQADYAGNNVDAAAERLEAAGYQRTGDSGWRHPVDGPLLVRLGTTGGNDLRELQLELGRAQLERAGFEVEIDNEPGGLFLARRPFAPEALTASASGGVSGNDDLWDIAQFSWVSGPWPGRVTGSYRSGSPINPYGFNNPAFDVAATACDAVTDDGERGRCYNDLDRFVTTLDEGDDGLFVIPLTQRPRFYGHGDGVSAVGAAPDVVAGGPLVNIGDAVLGR